MRGCLVCGAILVFVGSCLAQGGRTTRIICMGDSITRGVREGVGAEQIYEGVLQKRLTEAGYGVEVIASGIGSEATDAALNRLDQSVLARKPDYVTIMYGTNDAYWYPDKTGPYMTIEQYEANLRELVTRVRAAGAVPVLVTSPPMTFALEKITAMNPAYHQNGITFEIQRYVHVVRHVARDMQVPLVDVYAAYGELALAGRNIDDYFTDGCHPNAAGHEVVAGWFVEVFEDLLGKR